MADWTAKATSSISKLSDVLFEQVKSDMQLNGSVSNDTLWALHCVYGSPFLSALDLVDKHTVCHFTAGSKQAYQVKSSAGLKYYTCHIKPNLYCSCPSFAFGNSSDESAAILFCKHLLAVQMSISMDTVVHETLSNEDFNERFEQTINI